MNNKIIFNKHYHGFEDVYDLERDISEMWSEPSAKGIPGEFQGTVTVTVTYTPSEDDPSGEEE
jgi:glutamate-1-semialdehyde aminotransferase